MCDLSQFKKQKRLFLEEENPHFHEELEHNPPHVMIWSVISARHIFGPYFFEGSVIQHTCLTMLRDRLVPQLERMNLIGKVWFQQGGAPAHYAISVREYLSDVFRDK
jgi:hypothetical protein